MLRGRRIFSKELDGTLDIQMANANCCRFNRWGTLVAVGATDGRVFIIDFITKGVVKNWAAHLLPVTCLSWSRNGRLLLTASADTSVVIWELLSGNPTLKLKYSQGIISALFNPRSHQRVIAVTDPLAADDTVSAVAFDRRGNYVITGTTKGRILIFDAKTLKHMCFVRQGSSQQIRQIVVARKGSFILTNSQDRVIRRYDLDELLRTPRGTVVEPIQKLSDMVNRAAWKSVCTSWDGEYICGANSKQHSLVVWERNSGSLIKILHGAKGESLHDVQWHPNRAVILSVANGVVSIWTQAHVENWSAFAPEFQELEENAKYHETEGEFDQEDEDKEEEVKHDSKELDQEELDVVNVQASDMQCSSDEEGDLLAAVLPTPQGRDPLWFLPVAPDVENPDVKLEPQSLIDYPQASRSCTKTEPIDDPIDLRRRSLSNSAAMNKPAVKARRMAK